MSMVITNIIILTNLYIVFKHFQRGISFYILIGERSSCMRRCLFRSPGKQMHGTIHQLIDGNMLCKCCAKKKYNNFPCFFPPLIRRAAEPPGKPLADSPGSSSTSRLVQRARTIRPYFYSMLHKPAVLLLPDHFSSLCTIYL